MHLSEYAESLGASSEAADAKVCGAQFEVQGYMFGSCISLWELALVAGKDGVKLLTQVSACTDKAVGFRCHKERCSLNLRGSGAIASHDSAMRVEYGQIAHGFAHAQVVCMPFGGDAWVGR